MFFKRVLRLFAASGDRAQGPVLGYRFENRELLAQALRHRSYAYASDGGREKSNERLEFLGDAVLDLVVTEFLFSTYPEEQEGELSQIKSLVVSKKVLIEAAEKIELGTHLLLSDSEDRSGGRNRVSILADAFEAVIAAIYLDGGLGCAAKFIRETVLCDIDKYLADADNVNYKSQLLELTQGKGLGSPAYSVVSEHGPDHNKVFEVSVAVGEETWGSGAGKNKKSAEQMAARNALYYKRELLTPPQGEKT